MTTPSDPAGPRWTHGLQTQLPVLVGLLSEEARTRLSGGEKTEIEAALAEHLKVVNAERAQGWIDEKSPVVWATA